MARFEGSLLAAAGRSAQAAEFAFQRGAISVLEVPRGDVDRLADGAVHQGLALSVPAFEYLHPDFFGVPLWLPALYLCAASVVGQGARRWLLMRTPSTPGAPPPTRSGNCS